jgi:preprotein translocase subunit YajC
MTMLAQQLIDATEQGGEAFIAMTLMVVIFAFTLFMLDRVRKRRMDSDEERSARD